MASNSSKQLITSNRSRANSTKKNFLITQYTNFSIGSPQHHNHTSFMRTSTSFLTPNKPLNRTGEGLKDLFGAGSDPLAKKQEFSILARSPKNLMNATFMKPPYVEVMHPPIMDLFAHTRATLISHTKYSSSCIGRIGTNYSF